MLNITEKADPCYLEARDDLLDAIARLDPRSRDFRTPDGIEFRIRRKMPLRLYLAELERRIPGSAGWEVFSFNRNGRVDLGGTRRIPLRQAMAAGHPSWAPRGELEELAGQVSRSLPLPRSRRRR